MKADPSKAEQFTLRQLAMSEAKFFVVISLICVPFGISVFLLGSALITKGGFLNLLATVCK